MKFTEETEAGHYANAVSVHVNKNEIVLDFAYSMPNIVSDEEAEKLIKIVSRINLTHATAESFLKILTNAVLDWKNKTKENASGN